MHFRPFLLPLCGAVAAVIGTGCASGAAAQLRREVRLALDEPLPFIEGSVRPATPSPVAPDPGASGTSTPPSGSSAGPSGCAGIATAALGDHPRLRAARARVRASLFRSQAEEAPPTPRLLAETTDFPIGAPSMADHEGMYALGIGAELPPVGARDGRARSAAEHARAELAALSEAALSLWGDLRQTCAAWSTADAVRDGLRGHRAVLLELHDAVLARYGAGAERLSAVTRAGAELAAADRHVIEGEEEARAWRAALASLVDGAFELPGGAPPLPPRGDAPELASARNLALRSRASVAEAEARRRSAAALRDAAVADASTPTVELSGAWMQVPGARPGLGLMLSMSLPGFSGAGRAEADAARSELTAAQAEREAAERDVRAETSRALARVEATSRSLLALTERELPAARAALDAERASLSGGEFQLHAWIEAAHALREAHIDEARLRGALEAAWIDLERSVGQALPPANTEAGHD